ncbi:MAG TPA: carbon starvation CstA family protein, partial [Bacteroidales bacterium]|nr:carbon starvation CstA family protein [Bacteroidales bacterium]
PVAFLWIVLGSVFAGAVHDYFSGMLSIRHNGLSITEIVGIYLGKGTKQLMRNFRIPFHPVTLNGALSDK